MKTPDLPEDEDLRIKTLKSLEILDTASEERFDRIVRLAQRIFGVPICLVSLVDTERQWFKSCFGLDASETGRDISFCGHAILGSDLFIIENALEDERFRDNPLVTGPPDIRFYAGFPLQMPNRTRMGTLCIIDTKPRVFSEDDQNALRDLGQMVQYELASLSLATIDDLTEMSNRRGFYNLAQKALLNATRRNEQCFLIFLDLDKFKLINDNFGHAEGDKVLLTFAQFLEKVFRRSDTIGRLGGDEFAVLFSNVTEAQVDHCLTRLNEELQKHNQTSEGDYSLQFSYGKVKYLAQKHMDIIELVKEADQIMYENKKTK